MRLTKPPSEYIALGCLKRPMQSFKSMFGGSDASCALGALAEGFYLDGMVPLDSNVNIWLAELPHAMPWLHKARTPCPCCGFDQMDAVRCILHLNDNHLWSREKIGAWLDRVAAYAQAPEKGERAVADQAPENQKREGETLELVEA